MPPEIEEPSYLHNAFISYSRKDKEFAGLLERALERYYLPKDFKIQPRRLDIFRDEQDFTGVEYYQSLEKHLKDSAKLIVICSPNARKSGYVDDEIQRFLQVNRAVNIIPILLCGIPNNEASLTEQDEMAFPEALTTAMEMPLAVDYRSFNPRKDKIAKGAFAGSWYTLLANLFDRSRAEIEQRERRRLARVRNLWVAGASVIGVALSALTVWALISRELAFQQQNIAVSRQLAAQAELTRTQDVANLPRSVLLAVEAMRRLPSPEADQALREGLGLLPHRVARLWTEQGITAITFSPDGNYLGTGSFEGHVTIFDTFGRETARWSLADRVTSLAFSPDSKLIAASNESKIQVFDIMRRQKVAQFNDVFVVPSLAFSPNGRFLAAASRLDDFRELKSEVDMGQEQASWSYGGSSFVEGGERGTLWELNPEREVARMTHANGVNKVRFSSDGQYLATASSDHTAKVWRVTDGHLVMSVRHEGAVTDVAFSPDGKYLVTASGDKWESLPNETDNTVRLWSVPSGRAVANMMHGGGVNAVIFSPDGKRLASASDDGTARVWEAGSGREQLRMAHQGAVNSLAFSRDGKYLATASDDYTARLWDAKDGFEVMRMSHKERVYAVEFSADGKYLATAGSDGMAQIWETASSLRAKTLEQRSSLSAFALSPNGYDLMTVSHDGSARIFNLKTGEEVRRLAEPQENSAKVEENMCWKGGNGKASGGLASVAYSQDGSYVAATGENLTMVWKADSGQQVWRSDNKQALEVLAFSGDGRFLATAGWDTDELTLREAMSGREVGRLSTAGHVMALAFSPDAKYLLTASTSIRYLGLGSDSECSEAIHSIELWDMDTRKRILSLPSGDWVNAVAFSPNGKEFAMAGEDGSVFVRRLPDGLELERMDYLNAVNSVAFSPDGRYIATGDTNRTMKIWDLVTGRELVSRTAEEDSVIAVAFTPDQQYLVSATQNGVRLRLWRPDDLIAEACDRLPRNLTEKEWRQYIGDEPYRKTCQNLSPSNDEVKTVVTKPEQHQTAPTRDEDSMPATQPILAADADDLQWVWEKDISKMPSEIGSGMESIRGVRTNN